ncbi:MAG: ACP phosphodiesterase [Salinivirgaceae bacterium]|jgi:acyl carrier protein phosphodiesterase|nr:ACP phosphodiesterase [Salinivirgaceae bacterium]
MNILAHLYLSGKINNVMLGNFMGDFVKGNQYLNYSAEIQKGILLHREIDTFVDAHPLHKASRDRFRKEYGLHSGIVVDIVYDHYLATNWQKYSNIALEEYAQQAYTFIDKNLNIIPPRLQAITPYIINGNWLVMYKSIDGIEKVLYGMAKRTSLPQKVSFAIKIMNEHYDAFNDEFAQIMTDLQKMVEKSLYLTKFAIK